MPFVDNEHQALFFYKNGRRDADGKAVILIHQGHNKKRPSILKAGSKVSTYVLEFNGAERVKSRRREEEDKIINRVLQEDIPFESQNDAIEFLNGGSISGNENWKRVSDNRKLKELL